jgi:hypothetical protein
MFVEVEDAIVARLEARIGVATLPAKPRVTTMANLASIRDQSQGEASVFVAYNGLAGIQPLTGNPAIVTVMQQFIIWTVARGSSRHATQEGTREIADPIMVVVLEALCGWRYAAGKSMLELAETPGPAYEDGFGYFPLIFQFRTQVRGNP